jgi:hypothetical protein
MRTYKIAHNITSPKVCHAGSSSHSDLFGIVLKEGFPTSLPDGRQAGMTKDSITNETPQQSFEEFF